MNGRRFFVALTVAVALATAACGSSSKSVAPPPGGSSTTTTTHVVSKALGTGVTATSIKIGISLVDFKCIQQFIEFTRQNQQAVYQAFIDDVNKKGGINGRKIVADFNTECPLTPTSDLLVQVCTKFTDDDKVFAVMGNLVDAAQSAAMHTCIAKKHRTPVITFQVTQDMFNQVPPGLMVYPGTTPERSSAVLFELLKKQGTLEGKKVAVLAQQTSLPSVKAVVLPALKKIGVATGTPAYLTITGPDTTAAQSALDSFIERWKSEGVNALFVTGQNAVTKQFIEKVAKQMPGVILLTDVSDALSQGQDETKAGANPNPYEGMYLAGGFGAADYAKSDNWKYCAAIYKAQIGKDAPGPETNIKVNVGGKELQDQTYNLINDACQMVSTFQEIVTKMGQYVNVDNWVATVNSYGPIVNRGGGPYAALRQGKYDYDDTFQLQQFDSTLPPNGNWKALGPYQNLSS
ncbi:MAG: ABC transporter substrate-binding protein [Actinomycetota bacterium]|nr:ABC transporter substrate-binding protein [Actinomycetota bacterium]